MVKISASCLRVAVFLSPNSVSGLVGVGLRRECIISTAACVATFSEEILGEVIVTRGEYVVSETLFFRLGGVGRQSVVM